MEQPHSDACFVRAYPAATAEAWVDGHVHAIAGFGKVPLSVLCDDDCCLVSKILPDGTLVAALAPEAAFHTEAALLWRRSDEEFHLLCPRALAFGRLAPVSGHTCADPLTEQLISALLSQ